MGARSSRSHTCHICSHGFSTKGFDVIRHQKHELCTAVDAGTMVRYSSTNAGNTYYWRAMGSERTIICSKCRKSTMVKSPASI
jgi:hypothetical protein